MRKKYIIYLCTLGMAITMTGCTEIKNADPENGYATEYPMSAIEYNIFLNKEIGVIENVLITRITAAQNLSMGGAIDLEIRNTKEGIDKITDIKNELIVTVPAIDQESDHETVLQNAVEALSALEAYLEVLQNDNIGNLDTIMNRMSNIYLSLSGEANSYYK